MKYGFRKPSITKSIAARTTGKAKRNLKKAICHSYGTKGMGVFHPIKSSYNKLYRQTTVGINDVNKNSYKYRYNEGKSNNEYLNDFKETKQHFEFNGIIIIVAILCAIGIYGIISFLNLCFGPCNHEWKYVSHKHDYQCSRCHEWKKQLECVHEWVVTQDSANWYQKKCTKCGEFYTKKKF